jgi:hypothetical protein
MRIVRWVAGCTLAAAWATTAPGAVGAADMSDALPASVNMSYDDCLRELGAAAGRIGAAPEIVEDRPGLHVVRFETPEGRIVLGCSADAGYLAVATRG